MSWAGLSGAAVEISPSRVESERFGLSIARLVVGSAVLDGEAARPDRASTAIAEAGARVTDALRRSDADIVIARWPAQHTLFGAAAAASGRAVLPADVLMYWEVAAERLAGGPPLAGAPLGPGSQREAVRAEPATEASAEVRAVLASVVGDSFAGYGNHYTANPLLDRESALAGYLDWADRTLTTDPRDVVLLWEDDEPIGAATLSQDGTESEILLAGIVTEHQGRRLYGTLLEGIGREAARRGCTRVVISTQAHNTRVQRAWVRAGFAPFAAVTTIHAVRPELLGSARLR